MRQVDESKAQEGALKRGAKAVAKRQVKKLGKKALKKLGKAAAKAAVHAGVAAIKAIIVGVAGLSSSVLLIIGAVILAILIIFVATSMLFSFGGEDDLGEDAYELQQYIIEASNNSIDSSKPEQIPYKVPAELIIAAMQIYEGQSDTEASTKDAVDIFVDALKPTFEYETKTGYVESEQTTCVDGECTVSKKKTPFELELFKSVEAWDRTLSIENTAHFNDWIETEIHRTEYEWIPKYDEEGKRIPDEWIKREIPIVITTKTRSETFVPNEVETMDYSYFDRVLSESPFNYGTKDVRLVEALYAATGNDIQYSQMANGNSYIGFDGTIVPGTNIPMEFMQIYLEAEKVYKVEWYYLAAIHFTETAFSTHPTMVSSVGAEGHTQFMPCTWVGWSYPGCGGKGGLAIPEKDKHNPIVIKKHGGYGVDADKNGTASPWEIKDAIFATANMMSRNGWQGGTQADKDRAIRQYNNAGWYVDKINAAAKKFKDEAIYMTDASLSPDSFIRPTTGRNTSGFGPRSLGSRTYHYGIDIASTTAPPVVAVANGKVTRASGGCSQNGYVGNKCGGGWGNHLWVKFNVGGKTYEAVYAHLSKIAVAEGQNVVQGQLLGNMGHSGSSTGMHLHFELHAGARIGNGNALNPALYVPMN